MTNKEYLMAKEKARFEQQNAVSNQTTGGYRDTDNSLRVTLRSRLENQIIDAQSNIQYQQSRITDAEHGLALLNKNKSLEMLVDLLNR